MQIVPELQRLKLQVLENDLTPSSPPSLGKRGVAALEVDEVPISYTRTVSLGSRKQLCINDRLRKKSKDIDEACREILDGTSTTSSNLACFSPRITIEKGDKRCQFLPPMDEEERMLDFRDQILVSILVSSTSAF